MNAMIRTARIFGTWWRRKSNASPRQSLTTSTRRFGVIIVPNANVANGTIIVGAIITTR